MALTYNNMAKVMYTINQPFKELYKKSIEPQQQLQEYLEYSLVTIRLSKPLTQTKKATANHVREIVFRGCNPNNVIGSLEYMLSTFNNYALQLTRQDANTIEDVLKKINDLNYNCYTQAKVYDSSSLFYYAGFNANWEYKDKEGMLSLEQLESLCGHEIGDVINYNIALRKEFWETAAEYSKHLYNRYLSIKNSVSLIKISDTISIPLVVELIHLFKEKKYICDDLSFAQFETAICTLLRINKDAYKKAKSAFKGKTRNKYLNIEKIVEKIALQEKI